MTLIIFYLFLISNLFSKLLLTDICLPFTFYFTIFPLLLFAFLELLYFFYPCLTPCVHSNQQSTAIATIDSEALFRLCRGTNIITLFGVRPNFRTRTIALYIFLFYLCGFLFCWCERNTGRHFIGFY